MKYDTDTNKNDKDFELTWEGVRTAKREKLILGLYIVWYSLCGKTMYLLVGVSGSLWLSPRERESGSWERGRGTYVS